MEEHKESEEKTPFAIWQKTKEYKDIYEESKVNHPDLPEMTIQIMICGWYLEEVLGEKLPETKIPEEIKGTVPTVKVYSREEHFAKFGAMEETVYQTECPPTLLEKGLNQN